MNAVIAMVINYFPSFIFAKIMLGYTFLVCA